MKLTAVVHKFLPEIKGNIFTKVWLLVTKREHWEFDWHINLHFAEDLSDSQKPVKTCQIDMTETKLIN